MVYGFNAFRYRHILLPSGFLGGLSPSNLWHYVRFVALHVHGMTWVFRSSYSTPSLNRLPTEHLLSWLRLDSNQRWAMLMISKVLPSFTYLYFLLYYYIKFFIKNQILGINFLLQCHKLHLCYNQMSQVLHPKHNHLTYLLNLLLLHNHIDKNK